MVIYIPFKNKRIALKRQKALECRWCKRGCLLDVRGDYGVYTPCSYHARKIDIILDTIKCNALDEEEGIDGIRGNVKISWGIDGDGKVFVKLREYTIYLD